MITLLRPVDPDKPIRISNATAVEMEEPPPAWFTEQAAFIIETGNVEVDE